MGRAIRSFATRVGEHITKIKSVVIKQNVPRHYREYQNRDPQGSEFLIIDKYIPRWRGGAMTRGVSRLETYLIYELQSHSPFGLNIEWHINAFINKG